MKDFLIQSNIYEVNLRQYTYEGSLQAFIIHLPRLQDMGVQVLWLMPVHPIGIPHRKGTLGSYYSVKDYYAVNPEFGSREDFKNLVQAAHTLGMKVIIDWVANHAAWDNVWTVTNPEFFIHDDQGNFKPPFDWNDVIQFDHSNPEQQAAMLKAMEFWVSTYNIDGFRADLAHLTPLPFWLNARRSLDKIKPGLIWLAETEEINYYEAFDIIYAWKWMHATEDLIKNGNDTNHLISLLESQKQNLPNDALQLYFTTNHDENSWNGTEYEKYGIYARALAVFNYTWPGGVPLIYSGQEIPNFKRLKFFAKDELDWNDKAAMHGFYKKLNAFHGSTFTGGELKFLDSNNVLAFSRKKENQCVLTFLNLGQIKAESSFSIPFKGSYINLFSGEIISVSDEYSVDLAPGEFLLLQTTVDT